MFQRRVDLSTVCPHCGHERGESAELTASLHASASELRLAKLEIAALGGELATLRGLLKPGGVPPRPVED